MEPIGAKTSNAEKKKKKLTHCLYFCVLREKGDKDFIDSQVSGILNLKRKQEAPHTKHPQDVCHTICHHWVDHHHAVFDSTVCVLYFEPLLEAAIQKTRYKAYQNKNLGA